MMHGAETPYLPSPEEVIQFTSEYGERLEIVPFVRGAQPDDRLKLSLVRKVSPDGIFLPGRGWIPTVPNSFGLPPGETCPGRTAFCESCYAFGSIRSKGVKEMLDHNYRMLQNLETEENITPFLIEMVGRYAVTAEQHDVEPEDMLFRIHWSGDFYSRAYARAWVNTVREFPDVLFWAYTRSSRPPVDVVPDLDRIDNLILWLSTDTGNIDDIPAEYDHLPRANSAKDVVSAQKLARPDRTTITCPENLDRLKLMQDAEGACIKCRACFRAPIQRAVDVNFVTSGKYDSRPQSRYAAEVEERPAQLPEMPALTVQHSRYIIPVSE